MLADAMGCVQIFILVTLYTLRYKNSVTYYQTPPVLLELLVPTVLHDVALSACAAIRHLSMVKPYLVGDTVHKSAN